jgi:8-oxo-dGTP pyrophosphatase MutT (NUDIX family)
MGRNKKRITSDERCKREIKDHLEYMSKPGLPLTYRTLHILYDMRTVRYAWPWADVIRAGFLVLHYDGHTANPQLLLVRQRQCTMMIKGRLRDVGHHWGPPKGAVRASVDRSALEEAERELYEETKIDLHSRRFRITPAVFVVRRPNLGVRELLIYFVAVYIGPQPPEVTICNEELDDYKWIPVDALADIKDKITKPTQCVFAALEQIDFELRLEGSIGVPSSKALPFRGGV